MTPSLPFKLPTWIFIVTDLAFIGAAAVIASNSRRPYSEPVTFAIVACIIAGVFLTLVPIIANYEAQKNDTLDDRQRALESLARTITTSAEQISIAASGLHEIADLAQRNLRHAEKLPHQLQEKIAEFQAQLTNANDTEKEELEKEVAALRTSESERLDSIADKITKSTAEWTKLETAAQKRLSAAADTLAKTQADASALESKLIAVVAALEAKLGALETAAKNVSIPPSPPPSWPPVAAAVEAVSTAPESTEASVTDTPKTESTAHPPKRPRKPRREEAVAEETPTASTPSEPVSSTAVEAPPAPPAPEVKVEEPPPITTAAIPEVAPVAPHSAEPFAGNIAGIPPAETPATPAVEAAAVEPPAAEPAKPARKRIPKKSVPEMPDTSLTLDITETPAVESAEVHERVRTSDGATRLIVTAYIGIGNRLFIRGEGPGLSWDKGIPLQFVSIGKWRWETSDASDAVKFKLFKNDETECAALGAQSLDPGQQQEVTAAF